jgi:hypothetical protein
VGWSEPSRNHDASLQSLRVLAFVGLRARADERTRTANPCSSYECAARHLGATEQLNSRTAALSVVCWSGRCGLGAIDIGSLGPINTLSLDHKSGSPESYLGHLPDINKLPVVALEFIYTFLRNGALASFAPSPTRESCDEDHPGEGRERELSRH